MMNLPLHDMWSTVGDIPPVHRKLSVAMRCTFSDVTFSSLVACWIHGPRYISEWVKKSEWFFFADTLSFFLKHHTHTHAHARTHTRTHACMHAVTFQKSCKNVFTTSPTHTLTQLCFDVFL